MVRLVVQHHQLVNVADDHAQVHLGVRGRSSGPGAKEVVHRVLILSGGRNVVPGIDAVNVRQKDVPCRLRHPHVILNVQRELEIVSPIAAVHTVVRQHRIIFQEDAQPVKVLADAVQHDDVRRDHQEVPRQVRVRLVELMEVAPRQRETQHLCLARARGHLHHETSPRLIEHAARDDARGIEAHHVVLIPHACDLVQVDDRLQSLTLCKVVPELRKCAV